MHKKKRATKKPTKARIDWLQTLIDAIVDLIVGTLLILIGKAIG